MTNITLHGILAREFGNTFRMKIHKACNVVKAISVNRKGFNKRILDLSREGFNYTIIVDGSKITELQELSLQREPQEIHLVPCIIGSGPVTAAAILTGASSVLGFGTVFTATMASSQILGAIMLTTVSMGLSMLLAPDAPKQASASSAALQSSFSFSNKVNAASQGSPVPVGYGRLKVGSQVIQVCVKSYPQSRKSEVGTRSLSNNNNTVSTSNAQ